MNDRDLSGRESKSKASVRLACNRTGILLTEFRMPVMTAE